MYVSTCHKTVRACSSSCWLIQLYAVMESVFAEQKCAYIHIHYKMYKYVHVHVDIITRARVCAHTHTR